MWTKQDTSYVSNPGDLLSGTKTLPLSYCYCCLQDQFILLKIHILPATTRADAFTQRRLREWIRWKSMALRACQRSQPTARRPRLAVPPRAELRTAEQRTAVGRAATTDATQAVRASGRRPPGRPVTATLGTQATDRRREVPSKQPRGAHLLRNPCERTPESVKMV